MEFKPLYFFIALFLGFMFIYMFSKNPDIIYKGKTCKGNSCLAQEKDK